MIHPAARGDFPRRLDLADDVVFSYERASSEEADTRSWFSPVSGG